MRSVLLNSNMTPSNCFPRLDNIKAIKNISLRCPSPYVNFKIMTSVPTFYNINK